MTLDDNALSGPSWTRLGLCIVVGILLAWITLSPQHTAGFWVRDDHEYAAMFTGVRPIEFERVKNRDKIEFVLPKSNRVRLSGPDNTLAFADIPATLTQTEAFSPGLVGRFRPLFYLLRAVEVSLWGLDAGDFYIVRTLMFGLVLASILWIGWMATGPLGALCLTIVTIDMKLWGDVWCKLGPSEQYASVGLALFAIGMAALLRSVARADRASWTVPSILLSLGSILAAGSKENFIFTAVPLFLIGSWGLYRQRLSIPATAFIILALGFAAFMALAVAIMLRQLGTDVYGNSVGASERFQMLHTFLEHFGRSPALDLRPAMNMPLVQLCIVAAAIALAWSAAIIWHRQRTSPDPGRSRRLVVLSSVNLIAILWVVWEIIFYHGDWPTGGRYDLPGMLIVLVLCGSAFTLVSEAIGTGLLRSSLARLGFAMVLIMQLKAYGFDVPVHQAAIDNRQRTQQFTSDIRTLATVAAVHPDWPIYVDADHIWDFEMVLTLNAWMAWEHVTNPLFLRMSEPPVDLTGNPFSEALWATMKGASAEAAFGYRPLQARNPDRDAAHHCIKIVSILPWFAQAADGACTAVLLHWY